MTKIEDSCDDYRHKILGETPLLDKSETSFLQNMFILFRNLSRRLSSLCGVGPLLNASVRTLFNKIRSFGLSYAVKENQALRIEYIYEDKIYEVYIPYEKKLIPKTLNQSLHIFDKNKNIKNSVKQQPGVPYLISPWHLGGNSALLISLFSEKTIGEREKIY
jgi:hypothetical protein